MRKHPRFAKSIFGAALMIGPAITVFHSSTASASTHNGSVFIRSLAQQKLSEPTSRHRRRHPRVRAHHRKSRVVAQLRPAVITPAGGVWYSLRQCESADNYREDSGNGYYGAYQFSLSTWQEMGGSGFPENASIAVQDALAHRLQAMKGWHSWPSCSVQLGLA